MKTKFKKLNSCLFALLCAGALLTGVASCANDAGGSDYIADNGGDHYFGINGGSSGGAVGTSGGTGTGSSTTPAPTPSPTPALTPAPPVAMKTGLQIRNVLGNLGNIKSFAASSTPPADGVTTHLLSDVSESYPTAVKVWKDGRDVKYYAEGYTDSGIKIPLNENSLNMFARLPTLETIDVSGFDTSNVQNMFGMFDNEDYGPAAGGSITSIIGLNEWDTSNVTNMGRMFAMCGSLTSLDLSSWNTSKVTNMNVMFGYSSNLQTIYASQSFVTTQVTGYTEIFSECNALKGGNNTSYNSSHDSDKNYARIDDPANGRPGYFTPKP